MPVRLDGLEPAELRAMADDARAAAEAAPALREVLEPVADAAQATLEERPVGAVALPDRLDAEPADVIVDQREAMARAIVFRDDAGRPEPEREVWAAVVERLALARRVAKDDMAERRRSDPSLATYGELIASREAAERADDDFADLEIRDHPDGTTGPGSGRGEPAPWQEGPGYVGEGSQHAEPAETPLTDQLVEGSGMAGGTGGAGSQNLPADTGIKPATPSRPAKDPEPPDAASW